MCKLDKLTILSLGIITVSITWMTPFDVSMSIAITRALSTLTPSEVSIVIVCPCTDFAENTPPRPSVIAITQYNGKK